MQTTSITKLYIFLLLSLSIFPKAVLCAETGRNSIQFRLENNATLCVDARMKISNKQCDIKIGKNKIDEKSKKIINQSEESYVVFPQLEDNSSLFVMLFRIPSKLPHSTGYCGAGYEDHLTLFSRKNDELTFLDDVLLQSCLNSKILDSDQGDDIMKAMSIDEKKHTIKIRWLSGGDDNDHIIEIHNKKFVLQ